LGNEVAQPFFHVVQTGKHKSCWYKWHDKLNNINGLSDDLPVPRRQVTIYRAVVVNGKGTSLIDNREASGTECL
jgi:hypothetical protein